MAVRVEPDLVRGEPGELQLAGSLAGPWYRHEAGGRAPRVLDPVGDALVVKREVPARLVVRAVQDRVIDHLIRHQPARPSVLIRP